ncbi:MAG: flagellar protein FlaG [Nitrospira sp.]|nr:flagellar protein FlaG [Nitrospira sp.]
MITSVTSKADLLTTPARGSEPDHAAAKQPSAARTQSDTENTPTAPVDRTALEQAVAKVSEDIKAHDTNLKFEIDDSTDRVVVKVIEKDSGEVIRQFPPKEVLELAKFFNASKGFLLKEQA